MSTLLITGGSGFLGYHLCNELSKTFRKIIVVDIAPPISTEYPKNVIYFQADICNQNQLQEIFAREKPNFVIHGAAALPLYPRKRIFQVNVLGTKNILDTSLKHKVKRVTFISSTAVYGVPEKHPLYETDQMIGVGPYGESKILAEKLCQEYRKKGLCVPIIRPKTFIGTGRLGVFQILYDWVETGKRIPIIGNGKNKYQLLEVVDLVAAIALTLSEKESKVNDTFNVGATNYKTVFEDVSSLCRYARSGARVQKTPAFFVKFALQVFEAMKLSPLYKWVYGTADKDSFVSVEKIQTNLRWKPKYSNSDALIRSYQWYLEHKEQCKGTGVTHRVAWSQGILGLIKKFM
jgi:nucleoside-diphosphate-sugar epimerase